MRITGNARGGVRRHCNHFTRALRLGDRSPRSRARFRIEQMRADLTFHWEERFPFPARLLCSYRFSDDGDTFVLDYEALTTGDIRIRRRIK